MVVEGLADCQHLFPVAAGSRRVDFEVDVALHSQDTESQPRVILDSWALQLFREETGHLEKRHALDICPQAADLAVQRVAHVAGVLEQLLSFGEERPGAVPVVQQRQSVCFLQNRLGIRKPRLREHGSQS